MPNWIWLLIKSHSEKAFEGLLKSSILSQNLSGLYGGIRPLMEAITRSRPIMLSYKWGRKLVVWNCWVELVLARNGRCVFRMLLSKKVSFPLKEIWGHSEEAPTRAHPSQFRMYQFPAHLPSILHVSWQLHWWGCWFTLGLKNWRKFKALLWYCTI
jgi:hypothetical protein